MNALVVLIHKIYKMKRFENKRILITGGSSGIGLAGAKKIDRRGCKGYYHGKTESHLKMQQKTLGETTVIFTMMQKMKIHLKNWQN